MPVRGCREGVLPTVYSVQGWSAADGVQLVGETAEAAMSELSILILIMVMRQIHRIYCSDVGDL